MHVDGFVCHILYWSYALYSLLVLRICSQVDFYMLKDDDVYGIDWCVCIIGYGWIDIIHIVIVSYVEK